MHYKTIILIVILTSFFSNAQNKYISFTVDGIDMHLGMHVSEFRKECEKIKIIPKYVDNKTFDLPNGFVLLDSNNNIVQISRNWRPETYPEALEILVYLMEDKEFESSAYEIMTPTYKSRALRFTDGNYVICLFNTNIQEYIITK